jgi:hypothetical protein
LDSVKDNNLPTKSASAAILKTDEDVTGRPFLHHREVRPAGRNGQSKRESSPVFVAGKVLSDVSFLELVRDPRDSAESLLLHSSHRDSKIVHEVKSGRYLYLPTEAAHLFRHLPSNSMPYGSTAALFTKVAEFIAKHSGVDDNEASLLAFLAFSTFFCDCLSMAPCLLLFGTPLQAVSLLRVLSCVCRHAVPLVGSSVKGLPPELRPTRLVCQPDTRVARHLAAFQFSGFSILNSRPAQINGASVIYAGDAELKGPFADICLQLWVSPAIRSFGFAEEDHEAATITTLQNQLLTYRLQNYSKVRASQFDVVEFCGAAREYARTLGRCIVNAPDLRSRLTALLRAQDDAERTESASKLDAVVAEALVVCCHQRKTSVHVGDVARLVNAILGRDGEGIELSPKQVGGRMKRLGFRTTRLDSGGRGIILLKGECARIHKLARALGAATVREGLPGCPDCNKQ